MFRALFAAALLASPAVADDFEAVSSPRSVEATMDALVSAVEEAGATVFARIDHSEGASSVNLTLPEAQLLVFGNPELGTQAMQDDIRAGLMLPLRVLVYTDAQGVTQVFWEEAEEMFDDMDIDDDAPYVRNMEDALRMLTGKAVAD